MADPTKFDLNKEILSWREELWMSGKFSSDELDELESHLRDEASCASFAPLLDEEKFVLAKHKLGDKTILEKAYTKKRHLLSFLQVSWLAQAFICVILFKFFSQLFMFVLGDIDMALMMDDYYLEMSLFFGSQLISALLPFLLFRKLLHMSRQESKLHKANGLAIISVLITLTGLLIYSRFSPFGFIVKMPMAFNAVPYLIVVSLFIAFIIANFRYWRKFNVAHS